MNTPTDTLLKLPPATLKALAALSAERETLQNKIDDLNRRAIELLGIRSSKKNTPSAVLAQRRPHGSVKPAILQALQAAGKKGLSVLEIAALTDLDRKTVDRWVFSDSAKATKGLKKLGPARYCYLDGNGR